ncbi:hypothetical protein [Algivirga pacifica]|uniref:Uncharacterized protein n=1 Tax=Algivirga pacifica TaxID=1162670 RepID=A0ABP9D9B6_9BACT
MNKHRIHSCLFFLFYFFSQVSVAQNIGYHYAIDGTPIDNLFDPISFNPEVQITVPYGGLTPFKGGEVHFANGQKAKGFIALGKTPEYIHFTQKLPSKGKKIPIKEIKFFVMNNQRYWTVSNFLYGDFGGTPQATPVYVRELTKLGDKLFLAYTYPLMSKSKTVYLYKDTNGVIKQVPRKKSERLAFFKQIEPAWESVLTEEQLKEMEAIGVIWYLEAYNRYKSQLKVYHDSNMRETIGQTSTSVYYSLYSQFEKKYYKKEFFDLDGHKVQTRIQTAIYPYDLQSVMYYDSLGKLQRSIKMSNDINDMYGMTDFLYDQNTNYMDVKDYDENEKLHIHRLRVYEDNWSNFNSKIKKDFYMSVLNAQEEEVDVDSVWDSHRQAFVVREFNGNFLEEAYYENEEKEKVYLYLRNAKKPLKGIKSMTLGQNFLMPYEVLFEQKRGYLLLKINVHKDGSYNIGVLKPFHKVVDNYVMGAVIQKLLKTSNLKKVKYKGDYIEREFVLPVYLTNSAPFTAPRIYYFPAF